MNAIPTFLTVPLLGASSSGQNFRAPPARGRLSKAFSLVELLAAVTIVGIMAFFAIPQVTKMRGDAEVNLAISRAEALNTAIASLIQVRGRTQASSVDWPSATTNDARYLLIKPYLAYAETSITLYMPSGYSAIFPTSLEPLRKVSLTGPTGTILY